MAPRCVTTLLRLSSPTFNVINLRGSRQPSANTTYSWEVSGHWIQSCFLGDGGAERCGEERCVDEEEVSRGYGVEEEQLCMCGAAFFRHWFESFCGRVLCTSSLFVCMFCPFFYSPPHPLSRSYRHHLSTTTNTKFVLSKWAQATDQLLGDMYLLSMRTGGNWLTWPLKL